MHPHEKPAEFQRRFSRMDFRSSNVNKSHSEQIAEQIAEFERKGGTINTIPTGFGAHQAGQVVVSDEPDGMALPRPNKKQKKTALKPRSKPVFEAGLICLSDAAKILGISANTAFYWAQQGKLKVVHSAQNSRAKLVRESDVRALKKVMHEPKKPANAELINLKQAAAVLHVNPATTSLWAKKGILKAEYDPVIGKKEKFVKMADVLALKESFSKGKKSK